MDMYAPFIGLTSALSIIGIFIGHCITIYKLHDKHMKHLKECCCPKEKKE